MILFFVLCLLFILRRKIDSFSIAAAGIAIYYFPVYTGLLWSLDSSARSIGIGQPANTDLKISILAIFSFLYFASILKFRVVNNYSSRYKLNDDAVMYIVTMLCLILSCYIVPISLQYEGKVARALSIGIFHVIFEYLFSLGVAFSLYFAVVKVGAVRKLPYIFIFSALTFIAVLVFQTRSVAFFSVLSVFLYFAYEKKINYRLLIAPKHLLAIGFVILLLVGKHLSNVMFYGVQYEDWGLVFLDSIESFIISSALNYLYDSGLNVHSLAHVHYNFLPVFSSNTLDYHDLIKKFIFPDANYGMGRNPIGELWMNYRWMGIFLYCFILSLKCYFFDFVLKRTEGLIRVFLCLLMFFSVFYINRNSIQTDIVFHRNYFLIFGAIIITSSLVFTTYLARKRNLQVKNPELRSGDAT